MTVSLGNCDYCTLPMEDSSFTFGGCEHTVCMLCGATYSWTDCPVCADLFRPEDSLED